MVLEGRVALVTGGGRGIGRAIAIALGKRGARVGLVARSPEQLAEAAAATERAGGVAVVAVADLADRERLADALRRVTAALGPVDILVNNAALVEPAGPAIRLDPEEFARALDVNLLAPVRLTMAVLPVMLERSWGRVINVSTRAVVRPATSLGLNAYTASKSALEAHTINLAAELGGTGVTSNVFRPVTVDTAMQEWLRKQPIEKVGTALHDHFAGIHAEGRLVPPEQPAELLVQMLAGDANGRVVDG